MNGNEIVSKHKRTNEQEDGNQEENITNGYTQYIYLCSTIVNICNSLVMVMVCQNLAIFYSDYAQMLPLSVSVVDKGELS